MKGRKRKPDALRVLGGNTRKDRMNPNAPIPSAELPEPPTWLDQEEVSAFRQFVDCVAEMGYASKSHTVGYALLASTYMEVQRLNLIVHEEGFVSEGNRGAIRHPAAAQFGDAKRRLTSLLAEFGLTAASVGKVHVPKAGEQGNPWAKFA